MKTILIVSPHGDDELLGMGGYIINEIQKGNKVHVIFGTDGYPERDNAKIRAAEIEEVSKFVGFSYEILYPNMDCLLYTIDKREITRRIDKRIEELNRDKLPICIAKTQYSFSDNKNLLGAPKNFKITINDVKLSNGAEFIVCIAGDIMTMPGLPKIPVAENIDIDKNGEIIGLF